ncbi:MAG TPA: ShlB/FhaC/HecB family hemolysin secretion/activation protein [Oxalicibacterium sp.]|nr:ShlB/FhaC/HecB family hemolysin secretion/activation protein [Oxalicibacterium sp.]
MSRKKRIDLAAARYASAVPLALLMLHSGAGLAAEAPITPGSVLDTLGVGKPRMPATPPQVLLPVQTAPSPHDPRAKRFRVNAFDFSGNTVFKKRLLKRLVERFVDMELNLHDLNKAADTITTFYHDRGYTLARAVIPAQRVANGVVNIQIIEGRIGKVRMSGNRRYSKAFIDARTQLLKPGMLVTTDRLETTMLLLNDLPGMSAKLVLEPGEAFGDTDAEIQLNEKLFGGSIGFNNFGRSETGHNRLDFGLNLNSPFGWGDQLSVSGSRTNEGLVRYGRLAYSIPLNTIGTRLSIGASRVVYAVDAATIAKLGVSGDVTTTDMTVTHPIARTRDDTEILSVGVKRDRLTQDTLGITTSDNAVTVMNFGYQVSLINEDTSVTNANFSLATNFKSVDNSISPERDNYSQQNAVLARWEMDVNHNAPLSGKWDLYLRADIMYSNQMLPDTEKFSLGGPSSVRGYRPSELRGDTGYLGTVELRRPFSIAGKYGIFRLTADTGEVTYKMSGRDSISGFPFRDNSNRLHSAGFGATFFPAKNVVASIDVARPIGKETLKGTDAFGNLTREEVPRSTQIWMSISASF